MIAIAFFNSQGGVGKTSLVYHLTWMFAEMGVQVIAADLDPQAGLTSMFLEEARLEELWPKGKHPQTIHGVIEPFLRGLGDIDNPHVEEVTPRIGLVAGDLALSGFEDKLSDAWAKCHTRDGGAFRAVTALYRALLVAAESRGAGAVLIDVGPNLTAINRSALVAADYVVIPLASDLFSLQGVRNLGPQLADWRCAWRDLQPKSPDPELTLPRGDMRPVGYVVMQHAVRSDRPVHASARWIARFPAEYRESVLQRPESSPPPPGQDPHCLASLRQYRSLMPLAREARKPMFHLKPADGAIGAHGYAVQDCYRDFADLAARLARACGLALAA